MSDAINPQHYKKGSKEVIEMMQNIWGVDNTIIFCEMNSFKYRMRAGLKPNQPIERDLKKAKWYEDKAQELKGVEQYDPLPENNEPIMEDSEYTKIESKINK